jgi:hypothetical protein
MSISLREMYNQIKSQSNEDINQIVPESEISELNSYKSLEALRTILNKLDEERNADSDDTNELVTCDEHTSFSFKGDKVSLHKIKTFIPKITNLSCNSDIIKKCECESLAGCECNTRTLTCSSVLSYSVTPACSSRTTATTSCGCQYVGATGYGSYYSSGYTYVYYYTTCTCDTAIGRSYYDTVENYGYSSGYTYYYSYYYTTTYCTSRTTYSVTCECKTRTTTNPCSCNTRSEGLCSSRIGCSCDQVCYCNTVKQFGKRK